MRRPLGIRFSRPARRDPPSRADLDDIQLNSAQWRRARVSTSQSKGIEGSTNPISIQRVSQAESGRNSECFLEKKGATKSVRSPARELPSRSLHACRKKGILYSTAARHSVRHRHETFLRMVLHDYALSIEGTEMY